MNGIDNRSQVEINAEVECAAQEIAYWTNWTRGPGRSGATTSARHAQCVAAKCCARKNFASAHPGTRTDGNSRNRPVYPGRHQYFLRPRHRAYTRHPGLLHVIEATLVAKRRHDELRRQRLSGRAYCEIDFGKEFDGCMGEIAFARAIYTARSGSPRRRARSLGRGSRD